MRTARIQLLLSIISLPLSCHLFAATRYWVGLLPGNWSAGINWSASSGGFGGAGAPGAGDYAVFDGGLLGASQGKCTINVPVNIAGITITSGYSGTIVQGGNTITVSGAAGFGGGTFTGGTANITIGGTFTISGTAFTSTSAAMELQGDAAFTGGRFAHNNGWVRFNDAAAGNITGTSPGFYDLEFTGCGSSYTISSTGNIGVVNSLNISGTASCILNTGTINLKGNLNLTNTATGGGGTATIAFTGTTDQNITGTLSVNESSLPGIAINKASGTLRFPALITVCGNWTYTAATMDLSTSNSTIVFAKTLTISGSSHALNNVVFEGNNNWTFTVGTGTILTVSGTLTTTGASGILINAPVAGATVIQAQGDILINNTSAGGGGNGLILINASGAQAITSTAAAGQGLLPYIRIQKAAGTLTLNGVISESRDWVWASGAVAPTSSTIVFGGNDLSVTSMGMSFYNVAVSGNTVTLANSLTVNNDLDISGAAVLDPGANTIHLGGNWTDWGSGGFTEAGSTVDLNGSALQTISSPGGENFGSLTINNPGSGIRLSNNVFVAGTFTMNQGNVNLNGNTLELGSSAASKGTLIYTSGNLTGSGSFIRWFSTASVPDGSDAGLFPMGTATDIRPFYVSAPATGPSTGGTISVSYTDAATNTLAPGFSDGASAIVVRKDLHWALSTGSGLTGGTYNLDLRGTDFGLIGSVSDLRMTLPGSTLGTAGINAGTISDPQVNRTGLTAADLSNTFYIASVNGINTPLPVDLISFTASIKGRGVAIQWATAAETVNDHFDVQRSANGKDWSRLETVEGSGNTSKDQFYASFDPAPYPGTSYYRILQVDLDGKQNISPVVSVHVDLQKAISIYPNPVSYSLTVQLAAGGKYDISLLDQSGQTLKTIHQAGSSPEINVSDLVNGIYFLRIANANHVEMREVVVRR
jgi:hypothetical protein